MRADTKVDFLIPDGYETNEMNDKIPKYKSIGVFDSIIPPFSLAETQVYGATFTQSNIKVLCRYRQTLGAKIVKINDERYEVKEKKDYKKIILFICKKVVGKNVNSN